MTDNELKKLAVSWYQAKEIIKRLNTNLASCTNKNVQIADADVVINMSNITNPTYYTCTCSTGITSLTITVADIMPEVNIRFTVADSVTGALPIQINGTAYVINDADDFEAEGGETYEISIRKSVMVIGKLVAYTNSAS